MRKQRREPPQIVVFAALSASVIFLSANHLSALARPLYMAGGLGIAAYYRRQSPFAYVTATLWFWSMSPFIRRLTDYYGGFTVTNLVLVTPNVICGFMIWDIATSGQVFRRRESLLGGVALLAVCYGLVVSLARGDIVPGAIAAADWFCPVTYYFYCLQHANRVGEAERHFQSFVPINMLLIGLYGVYQYVSPPPWDVRWVLDSQMSSVGVPIPFGLKPFSTLNGPGLSAVWVAALVLFSLHFRNKLTVVALPAALLLLVLTLVRAIISGTIIGFLLALLLGRGRMLRSGLLVAVTVAAAFGILGLLDPKAGASIAHRFDTLNHLDQDVSANAREALYASAPGLIADHPLGLGIGALGRGAVASGNDDFAVVDSGPLAIYLALGWVAGSLYLFGMIGVTIQSIRAAVVSGSPAALAAAAVALGGVSVLLFTNLVGLQGVVIWLAAGYASAIELRPRLAEAARAPLGVTGPTA